MAETREDVLREFAACNTHNEFDGFRTFDMADEIVRLRAKLQAARERVEGSRRYDLIGDCEGESGRCRAGIGPVDDGDFVVYADVLSVLGGDEWATTPHSDSLTAPTASTRSSGATGCTR